MAEPPSLDDRCERAFWRADGTLGRRFFQRGGRRDLVATAVAGVAAILVALGGFVWQMAHGQAGTDFAVVAGVAGIGYLVTLAWLRWRD